MKIGIGLVGLGMVAGTHVRALRDLADVAEIRGVYARDPDRRAAFGAQWSLPEAESLEALLAREEIGALIILTPPDARREIVAAAAAAKKPVLIEKPLERGTAAAAELVEIARKGGIPLGVVFQHRFRPGTAQLKRRIDAGEFGALAAVRVEIPWWRPQSYYDEPGRGTYARDGGGVLITQAIHTLDLLQHLAGPAAEVFAMAATTKLHRMESEDFVAAGLRFACGAPGALMATTAAYPGGADSIALEFEKASVRLASGVLTILRQDGSSEVVGAEGGGGGGADPMAFTHAWHAAALRDFLEALREGRPPAVDGEEALKVHRLIDALILSARERRPVATQELTKPASDA